MFLGVFPVGKSHLCGFGDDRMMNKIKKPEEKQW
jgi:hypothetical protein